VPAADDLGDTDEGYAQMSYPEFLEALCGVGCYKRCNPYTPLYQRVDAFLEQNILARTVGTKG